MRKIRIIFIVLFLLSLLMSIDFGFNFSLINFFGDRLWSYERFLKAFEISTWITFVLLVINIVLLLYRLSGFQKEESGIETGRHLTKRGNHQ